GDAVGSHTRVRVVKNKVAPPFKEAEFDIMYGEGISRDGELLDLAVKLDIIQKSGSWFSYNEERLAQGRDNTKAMIKADPELTAKLEQQILENIDKLNPVRRTVAPKSIQPTEIPIEAAAKVTAGAAKAKIDISVDD
ncbi:MAG: DNA recombination/repair protein RecA, partial [Oscillospiraceae bacterium]|nr:DNA recombination/repair protein RecA [Oscillospiraceae bacterium]